MYPEGLEMSNLMSFINEDLSFTINELFKLKEIQKLFANRDLLIQVILSK